MPAPRTANIRRNCIGRQIINSMSLYLKVLKKGTIKRPRWPWPTTCAIFASDPWKRRCKNPQTHRNKKDPEYSHGRFIRQSGIPVAWCRACAPVHIRLSSSLSLPLEKFNHVENVDRMVHVPAVAPGWINPGSFSEDVPEYTQFHREQG